MTHFVLLNLLFKTYVEVKIKIENTLKIKASVIFIEYLSTDKARSLERLCCLLYLHIIWLALNRFYLLINT